MSSEPASVGRVERRAAFTPTDMALLGVVAVWGFGYVAYQVGQRAVPTGLFNLVRYVVAVPLLWAFLLRSGEDWRLPRRDWPRALATGLIGVLVYSMLFASAAKMTTAANTSLLLALSPVWGVLMQWAGGKGAPSFRFALGSLVAFGGAAVVIGAGGTKLAFGAASLLGDLLALASSVIWAWYGLVAQPLLKAHSGTKVQAWINLIALVGFAIYQGPAALAFDWRSVGPAAWLSMLYVAALATVFAHIVWYNAISRVGPHRVMLAMYLVPALAAASGALFLEQPFSVMQVVGAAAALGGVALVRRS